MDGTMMELLRQTQLNRASVDPVTPARPEELWAAAIISAHLGVDVEVHDDGSANSMYDLRVGPAQHASAAIEVTRAIDPEWTQTWNTGPARTSIRLTDLRGLWIVGISPGARIRGALDRRVESVLADAARLDIERLDEPVDLRYSHPALGDRVDELGIAYWFLLNPGAPGEVLLHMDLPETSASSPRIDIPAWIEGFLLDQARADVLEKLNLPEVAAREVFVWVDIAGAPPEVTQALAGLRRATPAHSMRPPALPPPVTGVWLCTEANFASQHRGLRWDGLRWVDVDVDVGLATG